MTLRESLHKAKTGEEVVDKTELTLIKVPKVKEQVDEDKSIESALTKIAHGKHWDELYNDIIDYPAPEGMYEKSFDGDKWDIKRFENYMIKVLPLIHLKNVLAYKSARLLSDVKGYTKYETMKRVK